MTSNIFEEYDDHTYFEEAHVDPKFEISQKHNVES